ncbi:MAG TPA: diaminopimelate decarboxylase, partial [Edaphobacter sp.]|nr:diaminopimelate decarboxylase [Edaphobacter sp.]
MPRKFAPQPSPRPFLYRNRTLYCDGVALSALAEKNGTPLYVYSARQIVERFRLFDDAFQDRPHTVCYAVKANSSLALLRLLAEQGAGFDIVSGGELERVRKANKAALRRVVFSGVGKQVWEIDAALKAGILLFNVESEAELELLAQRAQALRIRARFALRVNPDVFAETHPYISTGLSEHKFGIDIKAARAIYRKAKKSKWIEAAGVSVHIGSQIRKVDPFASALARVTALI